MSWQTWRALLVVDARGSWPVVAIVDAGPIGPGAGGSGKRVHLIGFDASEPVVAGLRQGSIEALSSESSQNGRTRRQDTGSIPRKATCRTKDLNRRSSGHARKYDTRKRSGH